MVVPWEAPEGRGSVQVPPFGPAPSGVLERGEIPLLLHSLLAQQYGRDGFHRDRNSASHTVITRSILPLPS